MRQGRGSKSPCLTLQNYPSAQAPRRGADMANHERSIRGGYLPLIIAEALFAVSSTSLCRGQTPSVETAAADAHDQNVQPTLKGRPRYVASPGDVLQVSFPLSPEYDQSLTVAPDGFVSLRGVWDLSVVGKS